jgi:two-component system, chemotaxis family, chemotaxis protein CheY
MFETIIDNAMRIMVVDDSEAVRELLSLILKNEGFDVVESNNGKDALKKLNKVNADMLITDLYMPEMNGMQLVERLRSCSRFKFMPVIMVSSENHESIIKKAKQIGVDEWLMKPFIRSDIMNVIRKCMHSQELQKAYRRRTIRPTGYVLTAW